MFALGAWQACGTVLFSALQHASSSQWRGTYLRLPLAGLVPANGVAATAAAGALCATWAVWQSVVDLVHRFARLTDRLVRKAPDGEEKFRRVRPD
jgi:hypothetical protein